MLRAPRAPDVGPGGIRDDPQRPCGNVAHQAPGLGALSAMQDGRRPALGRRRNPPLRLFPSSVRSSSGRQGRPDAGGLG
ncbi:MAG: hypothetical protein M3228_01590 [Actinomycetota bacterium]|nr:hypothetical protein [Actinomycetota bacterium]